MSKAFVDLPGRALSPALLLFAVLAAGRPGAETLGLAGTGQDGAVLVPDLRLDGVIVAQNPAASIALVRRSGDTRARVLRVGDEYAGCVLLEVSRDSVLFQGPSGVLRLDLSGARHLVGGGPGEAEPSREETDTGGSWERRRFPREPSRERLEKEIGVILADTKLEPEVESGEVLGLRLARLPDGTLLSESGLLPGDVLMSLNGEPLADLDALWEALAHLDGEDELRLVVRRRGHLVRLAYELTP